ncbi:hypothetical protein AK812_SmicGene32697 [Symbiodinium microadriaticum]|uniref:Uncharacterized protein n=1 Tax=Symbiodinium microadriaticum TaxID=2951 RepID=A0A1Q9CTG7_SYMMI|nr:hypothetical protein AK812_SmicGene32697 [Symbiodinium microadriaticum]
MATGVPETYLWYNLKVLNDNWFEVALRTDASPPELSVPTPASRSPELNKNTRKTARAYETDLAYIGERYDVLSRISRMPPRPSYALPEDGFNEQEKWMK